MSYILWAIPGSILILGLEGLFRSGWHWDEYWWLFIPLALAVNYCVYRTVIGSPTYLTGIIIFPLLNSVGRIVISLLILEEPLTKGNLAAASALLGGAIIGRVWR